MWRNEEEIKQKIPPSKLQQVSDELVTMSLQDILPRFEEERVSSIRSLEATDLYLKTFANR